MENNNGRADSPLSNEIPRRNPSADNAIGTEDGDIGGNRGTNSRTRGSRLEGKAEKGRDSFEARTRGNRTNFDATIENRFCCKLKKWLWIFFLAKSSSGNSSSNSSCIIRKTMERIFRIFDFVFFFPSFSFRDLFFAGNQCKIENPRKEIENFSLQAFLLRLVYILN